jgi:hypothetical protein
VQKEEDEERMHHLAIASRAPMFGHESWPRLKTRVGPRPYGSCEIIKTSVVLSQKMPYGRYEKFQEIHFAFSDLMVTLKDKKEDFY